MIAKKVKLDLVGRDGNAFSLIGAFRMQAKKDGWTLDEIAEAIGEATSGDYNHLLQTLIGYCE